MCFFFSGLDLAIFPPSIVGFQIPTMHLESVREVVQADPEESVHSPRRGMSYIRITP